MLVEAISKVILPWSYTKKAQIDAELLYCNLMLCGSKVALSSSLWLKYLLLMQPLYFYNYLENKNLLNLLDCERIFNFFL